MRRGYRFLKSLRREPWLEPYVEDDDETIDAARRRFEAAQEATLRRLLAEGVEVHRRYTKADGMLTTSLDPRGEIR